MKKILILAAVVAVMTACNNLASYFLKIRAACFSVLMASIDFIFLNFPLNHIILKRPATNKTNTDRVIMQTIEVKSLLRTTLTNSFIEIMF